MLPQQHVVLNPVTPQQLAVIVNTSGLSEETIKMKKKTIIALGKAEIAIGSLMVLIGFLMAIFNFESIRFGQGVCYGIWVIIAGGLGIRAGGNNSTLCLIKTHMAFSIVGSVASGTLFGYSTTWALVYSQRPLHCSLLSILSILSFATAILLILSASYCCCVNPCGCCEGCCDQEAYPNRQYQQHVMYVNVPQVVPGQVQGPAATAATYYIQTPVSQQPGSSNMFYGNPVPAQQTSLLEKVDAFPLDGKCPPAYQIE